MLANCPNCSQPLRENSKFCGKCGTKTNPANFAHSAQSSAVGMANKAKEVASKASAVAGPAMSRAGQVFTPVAKEAASKGWEGSKRGMNLATRVVTGGGRAAYSEAVSPIPNVSGQVIIPPTESMIPAPIEMAAILFTLSLLATGAFFALPDGYPVETGIAIGVIFIVLLVLSWLGIRRPYFTRITFASLASRVRGKAPNVPIYKFRIAEGANGHPLDVVMIGQRQGQPIVQGDLIELWGIRDKGRNELRAWKAQKMSPSGQSLGTLTTARLIPLVVALFVPATIVLIAWLISLL